MAAMRVVELAVGVAPAGVVDEDVAGEVTVTVVVIGMVIVTV